MSARNLFLPVLMALAVLCPLTAAAQAVGRVTDAAGEPVAGAGVVAPHGGTLADADGTFSLPGVAVGERLEVQAIGYQTAQVVWEGRPLVVVLQEDAIALGEVVIVGYGSQKVGQLTASVATLPAESLTALPVDNLSAALGGKVSGIISRQTTGLPGENDAQLYIRGVATTGTATPLVLVDGVERDFANLDPSEIAGISILKDAASAAVYGVKGAGGVILVTTKRGDKGTPRIHYNGSVTFSSNADMVELLDGPSYAYWHNLATDLDGVAREYTDAEIAWIRDGGDPQGVFGNTDWLSLIFKKTAVGQNHNLSVTGGTDDVRYFIGGSLLHQDGLIDHVWFRRYNLRSNIDVSLTRDLTLKLDLSGRLEQRHQNGVSAGAADPTASLDNGGSEYGYKNIVFYALSARPTLQPTLPDGTYLGYYNPLIARDESGFKDKESTYVQTAATLQWRVPSVPGLRLQGMVSYDLRNILSKELNLPHAQTTPQYGSLTATGGVNLTPGNSPHLPSGVNRLTDSHSLLTRYTDQLQLSYTHDRGRHSVDADLVWEQSGTRYRTFSAAKQDFAITDIPDLDFATEVPPNGVGGYRTATGRQGLLSRVNYALDGKYLMQASLRADWSARFAKGHRLGWFPALSAGWRLSEEPFLQGARGFLDQLKLRASWGRLGNDAISDFLFVQGLALSTTPTVVIGGTPVQSLSTTSIPNEEVTWETTTTYNVGLDVSLWGRLLYLQADAFYKYTDHILQSQAGEQPPSIGGNYAAIVNRGVVDVRGFELTAGHDHRIGTVSYTLSGNVSFASNRYVSTNDSDNIPLWQRRVGQPLGGVLGYVSDGLYQDEEDLAFSPKTSSGVRVGDIKYKDLNGDGKITLEDRTWIAGSQLPDWMFGLSGSARWRGFDLSFTLQGAAGTDLMLCGTYTALGYSDGTYFTQAFKWGSNPPRYLVEGSWRPDHTDAEYPRLGTATSANNAVASDFWRRDASYLRLKTLQVGYTLPVDAARRCGIHQARVYVNGNNLYTLSRLSRLGIDPEAPSVNNGYYPQQRVVSAGIDLTF